VLPAFHEHCGSAEVHWACVAPDPLGHAVACEQLVAPPVHWHCGSVLVQEACVSLESVGHALVCEHAVDVQLHCALAVHAFCVVAPLTQAVA
jgi:hypothetical protein